MRNSLLKEGGKIPPENLLHQIQAQAGPACLRRVQGLKNLRAVRRGDAASRIVHDNLHLCGSPPAGQAERAALGHGLYGILDEVEEGAA